MRISYAILYVVLIFAMILGITFPVYAWQGSFVVKTERYMLGSLVSDNYKTTIEDRHNNVFAEIVHPWTPCGEEVSQPTGTVLSSVNGSKIGTFSAYTVGKNEIYLRISLYSGKTVIYSITKNLQGDVFYNNTLYVNNRFFKIRTLVTGQYCYCPVR